MSAMNQVINSIRIMQRVQDRSRQQAEAQTRAIHALTTELGEVPFMMETLIGMLVQPSRPETTEPVN
ncbi:hypothetical protein DPMN_061796 [Dreissena polymorpha]|uniref:Uncharacterized protein n=1 Tax=Dreissena polymorpha TaxID=45954 RepID=A0A9D4HIS0_DREPO|nr:hypothetical protein DPMN_061796 [Dreissena polymorpha]